VAMRLGRKRRRMGLKVTIGRNRRAIERNDSKEMGCRDVG
jgi:hypothetical protein